MRCAWEQGTSPLSTLSGVAVRMLGVAQHQCLSPHGLHICDFSMDVKLEQRANIKFYMKLSKSGAETFEMI
jgi:hypothetical protein